MSTDGKDDSIESRLMHLVRVSEEDLAKIQDQALKVTLEARFQEIKDQFIVPRKKGNKYSGPPIYKEVPIDHEKYKTWNEEAMSRTEVAGKKSWINGDELKDIISPIPEYTIITSVITRPGRDSNVLSIKRGTPLKSGWKIEVDSRLSQRIPGLMDDLYAAAEKALTEYLSNNRGREDVHYGVLKMDKLDLSISDDELDDTKSMFLYEISAPLIIYYTRKPSR